MHSLRFDGESDQEFRQRAERAGHVARVLVDACLANDCVQEYIADESLPVYTVEAIRQSPVIRLEFEEAIAFGELGETFQATKSKHWGECLGILPLKADDWFFAERITYLYRENSRYNRRFEQRKRMKELLGRRWRPLVEKAKYKRHTKKMFLEDLTREQAGAIRRIFGVEPGQFWRACRGTAYLDLPTREMQLEFDFTTGEHEQKNPPC